MAEGTSASSKYDAKFLLQQFYTLTDGTEDLLPDWMPPDFLEQIREVGKFLGRERIGLRGTTMVRMHLVDGETFEAIAERLGCSSSTVYREVHSVYERVTAWANGKK